MKVGQMKERERKMDIKSVRTKERTREKKK
jgi:hypothetical protein